MDRFVIFNTYLTGLNILSIFLYLFIHNPPHVQA
uniref:Uncharacterized protein n=1 Tax=Anguilla anguilla TaxID=7936 RepID=A0A0E9UXH0_ANGAN